MLKDDMPYKDYMAEVERRASIMMDYVSGASVQFEDKTWCGSWLDIVRPSWNWEEFNYRIKPAEETP